MLEERRNSLVTLCLVSYKQEQFIRDSVRSALAQTYEPLQIVISDDCSPDGTYRIIQDEIAAYKGPHSVTAKQTALNSGFIKNFTSALRRAEGDFIVIQAGDDLSFPERVSELVSAWNQPHAVDLVVSNVVTIDEAGRELQRGWPQPVAFTRDLDTAVQYETSYALGCAVGFSKELVDRFGDIDPTVIQEDWIYSFRALVSRGIRVIDKPLVKYRQHGANIYHGRNSAGIQQTRRQFERFARNRHGIAVEWLKAWDIAGMPQDWRRNLLVKYERNWRYEAVAAQESRAVAIKAIIYGLSQGIGLRKAAGLIKRHVVRGSRLRGLNLAHPK